MEVRVNVYNMTRMNRVLGKYAVYHTSVAVGNLYEIYYGFLSKGRTGIDFADKIGELPSSMKGSMHESIVIGKINKPQSFFHRAANQIIRDPTWVSDNYNMLYHNCHKFALTFCQLLFGTNTIKHFPLYVFECEKYGQSMFESFFHVFVNKSNPPSFLGPNFAPEKFKNQSSARPLTI